jgi:hypothetical protein
MGNRIWMMIGGALAVVVAGVILYSPAADADRTIVLSTTAANITHGNFRRLEDAGWQLNICGNTMQTDGGVAPTIEPCVTCEPGAWAAGPATCLAAWKSANGL